MSPDLSREVLGVMAELCDLSPDVRLGQLLAHLGFLGEDQHGKPLWTIDDDQLLDVLYHHRAELLAREQDTPNDSAHQTEPPSAAAVLSG